MLRNGNQLMRMRSERRAKSGSIKDKQYRNVTTNFAAMSKYMISLSKSDSVKYTNKLKEFSLKENDDPFLLFENSKLNSDWVDDVSKWPPLEFPAIVSYLVSTPGPFTMEALQAYRSLDAYNYYVSGWVQTTYLRQIKGGKCILAARVMRSQATTEKPHQAWVGIKTCKDHAVVETAHCNCMAGLGEVCSHVAAIMFKIERAREIGFSNPACTDQPCAWNQNFTKKVEAVPLSEIEFSKPKRHEDPVEMSQSEPDPLPDDPTELLKELRKAVPDAVIFTVISPKKNVKKPRFPTNLTLLYNEKYCKLDESELLAFSKLSLEKLCVTNLQCQNLEKLTRKQSESKLWHTYRFGRVTASRIHEIVFGKTDLSESVIKSVCYGSNFSTEATRWGLEKENMALAQYIAVSGKSHTGLTLSKCGLLVSSEQPYLAASPDGVIECSCCGKGVVEVKCPFKYKDVYPCEIKDKDFFLREHDNDECDGSLRFKHKYFSQVQAQMGIYAVQYCDFVCYTNKGLHVERILFDCEFYNSMVERARIKFTDYILPELLTRRLKYKKPTQNKRQKVK